VSEIQSVEGRALKKGLSPARRSAYGALGLLGTALLIVIVGQLLQPPPIPLDHGLAVIRTSGSVELALPDGSASAALSGSGIPTDAVSIRWAPGGDFLALQTVTEVVVIDRAGVVAWRHSLRSEAANLAWSPDGSRIAILDGLDQAAEVEEGPVASEASLEILAATGTLEWQAPLDPHMELVRGYRSVAWSPDGGSVAFSGFTQRTSDGLQWSSIWIVDVKGQSIRRLTNDTASFDYGPVWTTEGGLVIARKSTSVSVIATLDPATGAATPIFERASSLCGTGSSCQPVHLDPLVPSPNGRLLAFRDPMFGPTVLDPESRENIRIPQTGLVADGAYAWSADGSALFLVGQAPGSPDPSNARSLGRFDLSTRTLATVLPDVRTFDLLPGPEG
jgi:hypothetical protein